MKLLSSNIVPIFFIVLAGLFVLLNKDGWGWCIFGALVTTSVPKSEGE